ncbi:MAG: MBL fold metallo-hydrolase [Planctomycetia bacterium]|jgi:metallo-beta-lactamase family protein|nr:MBL fold metallo-hydrolase [Planctomycetia bacterium]
MLDTSSLQILGAAGTVTGSKYLLRFQQQSLLLDCGLFQGLKELRLRNWAKVPFDLSQLKAVVLSHAHLDHTGYLPLLVRQGYRGPIYCSSGTADLLGVLLPDSAHLQEEEAARANRYSYSKHAPALPLYTVADAQATLRLVETKPYREAFSAVEGVQVRFRPNGHILGSCSVELELKTQPAFRIVFSGDVGRYGRPILHDPEPVPQADLLLVESTYGDRIHAPDPINELAEVVNQSVARGGALLIPAFAVGRTQELVWAIRQLEDSGRIPTLPVFIDSPMAIDVSALYCRHPEDHALDMKLLMDEKRCPLCCKKYQLTRTPDESKALNDIKGPFIVIAGAGMLTGGRILHHLKYRLPDPRTTVLLAGFQSIGTRGRLLQEGTKHLRIHGQDVPVRAAVVTLHGYSGHGDRNELLRWLSGFQKPPRLTLVVHGEPVPALALTTALQERWRSAVRPAQDGEVVSIARLLDDSPSSMSLPEVAR